MPDTPKDSREPSIFDRIEAVEIIQGTSALFFFDPHTGHLRMQGNEKPSHDYSQQNRGVEIALIGLLLSCDPAAKKFIVNCKEALTDRLRTIAAALSDSSDVHPLYTLRSLEFDLGIPNDGLTEEDSVVIAEMQLDSWADLLRCEKKHTGRKGFKRALPLEKYRKDFPKSFAFYDENKQKIEARAEEREHLTIVREKFDGSPGKLRKTGALWDSARLTIQASPKLIAKVRTSLPQPTPPRTRTKRVAPDCT